MSNTMSAIVYQVQSTHSYLPKKLIRRIPKTILANLSVVESIQENLMEKDKCLTGTGPSFNQLHSGYLQKMHHKYTRVTAEIIRQEKTYACPVLHFETSHIEVTPGTKESPQGTFSPSIRYDWVVFHVLTILCWR